MKANEAQFIDYQFKGRLCRCRVVIATLAEPPKAPRFDVKFVTPWMRSPEEAERAALLRYFPLYEERQGFKHPDDPSRTPFDRAPDAVVVTYRAA